MLNSLTTFPILFFISVVACVGGNSLNQFQSFLFFFFRLAFISNKKKLNFFFENETLLHICDDKHVCFFFIIIRRVLYLILYLQERVNADVNFFGYVKFETKKGNSGKVKGLKAT